LLKSIGDNAAVAWSEVQHWPLRHFQ